VEKDSVLNVIALWYLCVYRPNIKTNNDSFQWNEHTYAAVDRLVLMMFAASSLPTDPRLPHSNFCINKQTHQISHSHTQQRTTRRWERGHALMGVVSPQLGE